ncbi:superoxide dismutase domain protein, partial [Escherichia coli 8.0586]
RVRQRGFVHQNTLQPLHRTFHRSLTDGINHAHHLRGLKIVLCLNRRVRPAATFTHSVPLSCLMSESVYAPKTTGTPEGACVMTE